MLTFAIGLFILGAELPQWGGWTWRPIFLAGSGQDTSILKFSVDDESGEIALTAVGNVPGRLLDQFSFDTHEGYLRIATTEGLWNEAGNGLYVLQQNGQSLEIVGKSSVFSMNSTASPPMRAMNLSGLESSSRLFSSSSCARIS